MVLISDKMVDVFAEVQNLKKEKILIDSHFGILQFQASNFNLFNFESYFFEILNFKSLIF